MFSITRNGINSKILGFGIKQRPNIPAPEFRYEEIEVPGRDGNLIIENNEVEDIEIEVTINFMTHPDLWAEKFRQAKDWLLKRRDRELIFSDDEEMIYKVKHTQIDTAERTVRRLGEFAVTFLCEGYQYRRDGQHEHELNEIQYNPYAKSHPIYKIKGNGICRIYANGSVMTAEVQGNLIIDTERMLTYTEAGELKNVSVTGKYKSLYLKEMENNVTCSPGFEVKVIPNWRCL